ncbi:MAG: hypothetical protein UZ21_OP11001001102 [Microgenomates bacterium OLB22]|nr:MAG: hypothetical protein UZ21_OP11001001102 [Microgenomates bacterium OLB22]
MHNIVFDTNIFFNTEDGSDFPKNPQERIDLVGSFAARGKISGGLIFVTTPSVIDELKEFEQKNGFYIAELLAHVEVKAPSYLEIELSSSFVRDLIQESRDRSYRGLVIAEEVAVEVAKDNTLQAAATDHILFQKSIGAFITRLRERYRQATRHKWIDSTADLDLILLAKELDGLLFSNDEGVILWGRKLGLRELVVTQSKAKIENLLAVTKPAA